MGRTCAAVVAWILVASASAFAQTATVRSVALHRYWDPIPVGDCMTPALPATIAVPWVPQPGDRIAWCVDAPVTTAQATASDYAAYIDGDQKFPLAKACLSAAVGQAIQCLAVLPAAAIDRLRTFGPHRIEMTRATQTTPPVESPRSTVLQFQPAGCRVVDLAVSPPTVLDVVAPVFGNPGPPPDDPTTQEQTALAITLRTGQISQRTSSNTPNAATAIGLLRLNGWRVEWWRTQYEAPTPASSSTGGNWYLLAWCTGTAQ